MGEANLSEADLVLSGPRGRRFCWQLACAVRNQALQDRLWLAFHACPDPADDAAVERLADLLRQVDPGEIGELTEPALLECLADAVAFASYWQEPSEEDRLLADPRVVEALLPVAEAALTSPAAHWWRDPVDLTDQGYVQWLDQARTEPPRLTGAAQAVRAWRDDTLAREESARSWPPDPTANISASWWSTPSLHGLVETSRPRPGLGAVRLLLTEDDCGWQQARVWPLAPRPDVQVYEITGPDAWAALVERYPLRVTRSRRYDWWRATGRAGEWFIPDYNAVAADYDAVHLTMLGYLTTAGKTVQVTDGATLLAGWHPDTTVWLHDVLASSGEPLDWHRSQDAPDGNTADATTGWRPSPTGC